MFSFIESRLVKIGADSKEGSFLNRIIVSLRNIVLSRRFDKFRIRFLILPKVDEFIKKTCGNIDYTQYKNEALKSYAVQNDFGARQSGLFNLILLYLLVRITKPEVVIETGISAGRSSTAILEALARNNKGKLYSFDLDPSNNQRHESNVGKGYGEKYRTYVSWAPEGVDFPGWAVPDKYKDRWVVTLGDSNLTLPEVIEKLSQIDIFYHDSDHTYETMMNEFNSVWPKLSSGGFLFADNSPASSAFDVFSKENLTFISSIFYYSGLDCLRKK